MPTNVTAEYTGKGPDGRSTAVSVAVNGVADQVVNTTVTAVGTFNTATVTADVARSLVFAASDGVPPGRYEKVALGVFRKVD